MREVIGECVNLWCLIMCDHVKSFYMTVLGHVRVWSVMCNHVQSCATVFDHAWLCAATCDCRWSLRDWTLTTCSHGCWESHRQRMTISWSCIRRLPSSECSCVSSSLKSAVLNIFVYSTISQDTAKQDPTTPTNTDKHPPLTTINTTSCPEQ